MERLRKLIQARLGRVAAPLVRVLHRLGVTPTQISLAGVLVNVAAAALIARGEPAWGGLLYLVAGAFDFLDGSVARLADRATRFGAFLDSTLDRISEGVVFAALAYRFALDGAPLDAALTVLALLGSLLVSYTRARVEGLGGQCKVGLSTRAERVILLALGLMAGLESWAIYLLVVLTALTTFQRMAHARRELAGPG